MYGLELGRSVRRTRAGAYRGGRPPTACFRQCFDAVVSLITGNASGLLTPATSRGSSIKDLRKNTVKNRPSIIRFKVILLWLLAYWYRKLTLFARWHNVASGGFGMKNGVSDKVVFYPLFVSFLHYGCCFKISWYWLCIILVAYL